MHPLENLTGATERDRETLFSAGTGPSTGQPAAHSGDASRAGSGADGTANRDNTRGSNPSASQATHVVCAIPARYASERLPGKPLRLIAGKPMIQHVVERVRSVPGVARTVVLTDDERIEETVRAFGAEVEMTPVDCKSGTDRIAWAARSWATPLSEAGEPLRQAVINVQGDEPLIDRSIVERIAQHLANHPDDEMVTAATPFSQSMIDSGAASDASKVKVVTDLAGKALYFSRSMIPFVRDGATAANKPRLHVGLYGYRLDVLEALAELAPTPLEQAESLEQLRALEHGISIRVLNTDHQAFGVDTEQDLARAEELLNPELSGANP